MAMERWIIEEAIKRIGQMELCFDTLLKAADEDSSVIWEDALLQAHLHALIQYYEGGQWLLDYGLDEKGLLPQDMKRGVLAQDAVYNFLDRINRVDG